ncbi:beta-galactosidase trimerization domain-containing protein [Devosia rhodophyticola]|uniref:Beta-galactosidase trimerization domain-containing protein n=1 Tax=Devosia rhodophyticola TaxID=3026423 RepID=A0ABY7YYV8_9HYPH|nr:beta-galactosidase trimerization domain-containing protein [Devosia rhodophyticola]WDR06427.1 beta-galactosidase trimerization domain-containing protein [Devosia rhodophyticola]
MATATFSPLRYRQIHLDFHTSEHIADIGRDFDADQFVATLRDAHVDSISIFARCHHGWCYYPTKVGAPHPRLARQDLLGEMVDACRKADIETPIYITAQWDENLARTRPEWRVMSGRGTPPNNWPGDGSANYQLTAAWHSLCLNNPEYRKYLLDMGLEVAQAYAPPGLFYDIISSFECVCPRCVERMHADGRDPHSPLDRKANDAAVNAEFRREISAGIWAKHPQMRLFFNSGHIDKQGRARFDDYSHLELESLPTGVWGYDHFPTSARYAAALGMDFLGQTGKFHTSWGEFGGYKRADALIYECAQMVALGAKCLIGDQLHPLGHVDPDTYASIKPAYERVEKLEPFLRGARQLSEIAILSAEYFVTRVEKRGNPADDGAARMLMELKRPFDIVDPEMDFAPYRLLILPDVIPVDAGLATKLKTFVAQGGKIILSGTAGRDPQTGALAIDAGIEVVKPAIGFDPSYLVKTDASLGAHIPGSPVVMYGPVEAVRATSATVLAEGQPSYFNRTYEHFCSHLHAPVDSDAKSLGPVMTVSDNVGYLAYPVFEIYQDVGQPIYKYLVDNLIERLMPNALLRTNLPSAARVALVEQAAEKRLVAHLLFGGPQVRGRKAPDLAGATAHGNDRGHSGFGRYRGFSALNTDAKPGL